MQYNESTTERRDVELGFLRRNLPFLTRSLRAFIRSETLAHYEDVEIAQGEIVALSLIGLNPGISQNELAATLVFKKSAVTKLIKDLELRGLVSRSKTAADLRFNALTLTEAGQQKHALVLERVRRQHDAMLEGFSKEERDTLFGALNKLHDELAARHVARTGSGATPSGKPDD